MKLPSGWQNPSAASGPSSRSRLSPTSVLEIPTTRPARRYDSPSNTTAATASRRTSSDSGGVPPWPGGRGGSRWARRSASQASTAAGSEERGQDDKGTRPPGRRETPCRWSGPRQCQDAQGITDTLIQRRGRTFRRTFGPRRLRRRFHAGRLATQGGTHDQCAPASIRVTNVAHRLASSPEHHD
jgi:hypothetical protein